MPSYEGPAFAVKNSAPVINTAQFWAIGHYVFNTFKATGNHTVIAIRVPGYRTSGATGTIRVGIQTVTNPSMVSVPDGVWLAYEDVAVTTYTTSMASKWITLTVPYTLAKNTFYAIVANAQSGTFNSSTQIFFCGYNTVSYAGGAAFFPTTGRMAASNSITSGDYVLGYRTSSQSYYGVIMPLGDDAPTNVEQGARFTVPTGQYSSIECLGIRNKINAAGQQTVRLYDSSNNVIAIATPKFDITVGRAIYDTYWDTAVNLIAGQTYYWGSVCPTSTQWASQVSVDDPIDWTADTTWQFAKARRTTPISGAWTITTTENYEHQLILGNINPVITIYINPEVSIMVKAGTTSRTEYIYLNTAGFTFNTLGLSASYVREGGSRVNIPLVSQTVNGAYTSGGFVEVDSVNMPGLYRIDVPNALFASGVKTAAFEIINSNTVDRHLITYNFTPTMQIDMAQSVPISNTANTIGDALNAMRAVGFGKWVISGTNLSLYAPDNFTVVKSFTLNSSTAPTSRS
jgi:hypothetical protein